MHTKTIAARRIGSHARDGVVAIRIGSAGITYHVYSTLIAKHSEYFDRALNGDWKEAQEGVILLDNVDCNTFEIFIDWLHTQKLPAKYSEWLEPDIDTEGSSKTKLVQMAMVKACVFGDRFFAQQFRAATGYALVDLLLNFSAPFYEVVTYAFNHLPAGDLVLQAMIDVHCDRTTESIDENNGDAKLRDQLPHSFLLGAMSRYMEIKRKGRSTLIPCDYHRRGDGLEPDQESIKDLDVVGRKGGTSAPVRPITPDGLSSAISGFGSSTGSVFAWPVTPDRLPSANPGFGR